MKYTTEDLLKKYENKLESCFVVTFWKPDQPFGIFSQWASTPFTDGVKKYKNAEQYMMYQKAMLFNDAEIAGKILETTNPAEMKKLGRQIANFDQDVWDANKVEIVKAGNMMKFTQNLGPAGILKATGTHVLAEASPYDHVWGIGVGGTDAQNLAKWPEDAQNLLGFILMEVREETKDFQSLIAEHCAVYKRRAEMKAQHDKEARQ